MSKSVNDDLVTIIVKPGSKFYEGRKHSTNAEIAAVLEEHAKRYGALEEVFLLLARHVRALRADHEGPEPEGGSPSYTITSGTCGSCVTTDGRTGYTCAVNNVPQPGVFAAPERIGYRDLDSEGFAAGSSQSGRERDRRGVSRLRERRAEGGETEPEGVAIALEREVRRYTPPHNHEGPGAGRWGCGGMRSGRDRRRCVCRRSYRSVRGCNR